MTRQVSLATRVFAAQLIVILIAGVTLVATVVMVAPSLFLHHLAMTGEDSPIVQQHALEALESSFGVAFLSAAAAAIVAAVLLSWFVALRVSRPVKELAAAAQDVADGRYDIAVPSTGFGKEMTALSGAFQEMADDLAETEAARTRLLADLAHELRTPLATLEVHIDGMEDGIVPTDHETYQVMRDQVGRLRRLASDIKLASAAQEHALDLHTTAIPVADLLEAACDAAGPRYAAKEVTLTCRTDHIADVVVDVDPDRIQQVLANLLDNALRHTPKGGAVDVAGVRSPGKVVIMVTDDGDGIATDQLEAIFDRFHRVDTSRRHDGHEGSGLGLTIARAIVVDHGGTLAATSAGLGKGTTLTVILPTAPPPGSAS